MFGMKLHQEVVVVDDKVVTAALLAAGNRILTMFEGTDRKFYGVFPITRKFREDVRAYYTGDLRVDALKLNEDLEQISMALEAYGHDIYDEFCGSYSRTHSQ